MAIPDFQSIMLPLLQFASDGREHSMEEAVKAVANVLRLSDQSGTNSIQAGRSTHIC